MSGTTQGTTSLLALADELKEVAPHVEQVFDLKRGAALMQKAASVLERLAPLDPDIDVAPGEN